MTQFGREFDFCVFNATTTTEIYTLSLHDALPILRRRVVARRHLEVGEHRLAELQLHPGAALGDLQRGLDRVGPVDRKSTRLNSSHPSISYAVFCLKKKKSRRYPQIPHRMSAFRRD